MDKEILEVKLQLMVPTVETEEHIDGFEVEDLIRTAFDIPSGHAGDIIISYNDFVNYTKNIMGLTIESVTRVKAKHGID